MFSAFWPAQFPKRKRRFLEESMSISSGPYFSTRIWYSCSMLSSPPMVSVTPIQNFFPAVSNESAARITLSVV
eukprot:9806544-Heterocapsa_arctica.AAC.1